MTYRVSRLLLLSALLGPVAAGCSGEDDGLVDSDSDSGQPDLGDADVNGDGTVNVLVIDSTSSITGSTVAFAPDRVAAELRAILEGDEAVDLDVNVSAVDMYRTAVIDTGYGQGGSSYSWTYSAHSLAQWLYWPEGRESRWANLAGEETPWDHVVLAADPEIAAQTPGFYALGANRVAEVVASGGAKPILLMVWPSGGSTEAAADIAATAQRIRDLASVEVRLAPAGLAWSALDPTLQDGGAEHPSPNGAYVSAAAVYGQIAGQSAAQSSYRYEDALAEAAWSAVQDEWSRAAITGPRQASDPFAACGISDRILHFNHTGTSSENGIQRGLQWTLDRANVELVKGGGAPINFNYGRANTEFEPNKRYKIDPSAFEFSLGFAMQDHSNNGNTSMLYGLDQRRNPTENGTDLGVARYMIAQGEGPEARAIPIRALHAQLQAAIPEQSAYSDGWHMNKDLDKASGAFMYTLLTGHCAVDEAPADPSSAEWRSWMAHKTGYETAWTMTHLSGAAPCFKVLPESKESTWVSVEESASLDVSFGTAPSADVTVTLSVSDGTAASVSPSELVFTAASHNTPQTITLAASDASETTIELIATTSSPDPAFDGLVDRWEYAVVLAE